MGYLVASNLPPSILVLGAALGCDVTVRLAVDRGGRLPGTTRVRCWSGSRVVGQRAVPMAKMPAR
jgi:hypothetical protein